MSSYLQGEYIETESSVQTFTKMDQERIRIQRDGVLDDQVYPDQTRKWVNLILDFCWLILESSGVLASSCLNTEVIPFLHASS